MTPRIFILTIMGLLLSSCFCPPPEEKWVTALSQRIGSGYQALHAGSQELDQRVQAFCVGSAGIDAPRSQWRATMDAWQNVQWVRFGPIIENNDDWKIQFWPDKKNIAARKVNKILNNEQSITVEDVANASVVVQGLSAIELILFDEPYVSQFAEGAERAEKQCELLGAIAENLQVTTHKILQDWQDPEFQTGWQASVSGPQDGVHANAVSDVVGGMLAQMEKVKIDKLGGPLGYKNRNRQPNGYFSEGWRSESSLANIKTNLLSLQELIDNDDAYDLRRLLESNGNGVIADEFQTRINDALVQLATIDMPLRKAVMDVGARQQLEELHQSIAGINTLIKTKLTSALGVNLGFNANDGD